MHFETRSLGSPGLSWNCVPPGWPCTQRDPPASAYCVLGLKASIPLEALSSLSVYEVRKQVPSVLCPLPCLGTTPKINPGQQPRPTRPVSPQASGPEQSPLQPVSSRLPLEGLTRHLGPRWYLTPIMPVSCARKHSPCPGRTVLGAHKAFSSTREYWCEEGFLASQQARG